MIGNYIKAAKAALTTAKLMKTGQTTSYRTGDDGDIEAGRNTSFTVLAENNPFGNTNRFTDELGGQTYTKNIVIDWSTYDGSTVLGFRRSPINSGNWAASIDACLAVSIAPYTSGWRMPNITEVQNLINYSQTNGLDYSPFLGFGVGIWTSTTFVGATTEAFWCYNYYNRIEQRAKSVSSNYMPCRTFTVTGTTLS